MATNELARLEKMPEVAKVAAMLKDAHYQVNEIHQDQGPSYSTSSNCRSTMSRSNCRPGRSCFADQHHDDGQPIQGELGGTVSTTFTNSTKKLIKMSEHTSTTSRMHDVTSTGAISLAINRKYAGVKNTSKSSVTQK